MSLSSVRNLSKVGLTCYRCPILRCSAHTVCALPSTLYCNNRFVTTHTSGLDVVEGGIVKKVFGKVKNSLFRQKLKVGGFQLYETVADRLDYHTFMTVLKMPDTFHSWFLLTELHLWMLSVRLMADSDGKLIRNYLLEALWKDVNIRISKLGVEHVTTAKSQVVQLSEEFHAALVSYDEGLSDDKALASAVWRRLLERSTEASPQQLEALVKYIRQMLFTLDSVPMDELVLKRNYSWIPPKKLLGET